MNRSARLKERVAVVTGAGAKGGVGTGAAMALTLAREGARVVVLNRSAEAADAAVALIRGEGCECVRVLADVTSAADCVRAADEAMAAYGAVDVLVNNAASSQADSIVDGSEDAWDAVMDAELKGAARIIAAHRGAEEPVAVVREQTVAPPARALTCLVVLGFGRPALARIRLIEDAFGAGDAFERIDRK